MVTRGKGMWAIKVKGGQIRGYRRLDFGLRAHNAIILIMYHRIVPLKPILFY